MDGRNGKAQRAARIGLMAGCLCLCSWIRLALPGLVPITLQTLGVFLAAGLLGGRDGTTAILVYLLLGLAGLPVFAGFQSGAGVLFGPTGGYLVGFLATGLVSGGLAKRWRWTVKGLTAAFVVGLLACYGLGTAWYVLGYAGTERAVGVWGALCACVLPFCVPDACKIAAAVWIIRRIRPLLWKEKESGK